ncbi:class I SAM-dependent methyltransferase [Scopulibacillus cellulosilyticus]|uniref:Class I SAM-dependent methyltransferase n=1 Tax=Scopulibacillus cellulosilyticus TaxID=2665665 RepID=A0ABW2Q4L1_9BACL
MNVNHRKGKYGIDAPGVVINLPIIGVILLILSIVSFNVFPEQMRWIGRMISAVLFITCLICLFEAAAMIWSSKKGKVIECERLLDLIGLNGDEKVLDVGCGRGMVLHSAARRLTTGQAVGLDVWSEKDQSGNHPDVTLQNAKLEGVEDKIKLFNGDARDMPFADETFDVIVSSLAIHNIPSREEREMALRECVRVLKPNGRFAILDFQYVKDYAHVFQRLGIENVKVIGPHYVMFPPVKIVTGKKQIIEN